MVQGQPNIKVLSDEVINLIAAGEVVERPAAALKELVDNAIDAGATQIDVTLENGGIDQIQVQDNGNGIAPKELGLAVERHATSKLSEATDLSGIQTMGFRGEALSSISAVSHFRIRSRVPANKMGNELVVDFGKPNGDPKPIGMPKGTLVSATNLFQALPARKKFLRTANTEFQHCAKTLKEVALGAPDIEFSLTHQQKKTFRLTKTTRWKRIVQCLKWDWTPLHFEEKQDGATLEAFLSPTHQIQDRGELYLMVNGRAVRHRLLFAAIRNAYAQTLGPHHVPSGVVYLDLRPDWVDVNVHPQKLEVRFLNTERFYGWLLAAIRKAIEQSREIREITLETETPDPKPLPDAPVQATPQPLRSNPYPTSPRSTAPRPTQISESKPSPLTAPKPQPQPMSFPTIDESLSFRYLGQAKASYLVCEDEQGLVLVDQHALHEKLVFETLKEEAKDGLAIQQALIPKVVALPADKIALVQAHRDLLKQTGFEVDVFGDGDVALKSYPTLIEETKVEAAFLEIVDQLSELEENQSMDALLRPVLATVACHSVVRANQTLLPEKAKALLAQWDRLKEGWTCPHGRPVCFRLPFHQIRKHFERS